MNRLNILLLGGFTCVVALAVGRLAYDDAAVRPEPATPVNLLTAQSTPSKNAPSNARAGATAARPNSPAETKKIAAASASARKLPDGETPDDYVYVKTPVNTRKAPAASSSSRLAVSSAGSKGTATAIRKEPALTAAEYERSVADAAAVSDEDLDRAARRLERIAADEPNRAEAYEKLAAIRLRQGDYYQAHEMFESAMRRGGKATFTIMHDHSRGNFEPGPGATCVGELTLLPDEVRFEGADGHRFSASWSDLQDAGPNRFFGSRIGGFHVRVSAAGKSRNYNLAPASRDEREARILFDLFSANLSRQDTGSRQ